MYPFSIKSETRHLFFPCSNLPRPSNANFVIYSIILCILHNLSNYPSLQCIQFHTPQNASAIFLKKGPDYYKYPHIKTIISIHISTFYLIFENFKVSLNSQIEVNGIHYFVKIHYDAIL